MNNFITNLLLIKDQNITFVQIFGAITFIDCKCQYKNVQK